MARGIIKAISGISLAAAPLILFVAYQLHQVQQQVQPTPRTLTLAEFLANGPENDNAYVELTDVNFGKPVIEKSGKEWKWVWLPLYLTKPPAENAPAPEVVVRVSQIPNKAALDEYVQRTSVTALVCGRMPSLTPWTPKLPGRFVKNFPDLKPGEVTLLTEPEVRLAGWSWGAEVLFDPTTLGVAWASGGGLALLGLLGLLCLARAQPGDAAAAARAAPRATCSPALRGQVAQERATSRHEFNRLDWASRMFKMYLYLAAVGTLLLMVSMAGIYLLRRDVRTGLVVLLFDAGLIALNWCIFYFNNLYSAWGVAEIDVCPSGLRWRRTADGPVQTAIWSDITDLNVVAVNMVGYGMLSGWRHELTITFQSGERLKVAPFSLTDYLKFAKLVGEGYKEGALATTGIQGAVALASAERWAT